MYILRSHKIQSLPIVQFTIQRKEFKRKKVQNTPMTIFSRARDGEVQFRLSDRA